MAASDSPDEEAKAPKVAAVAERTAEELSDLDALRGVGYYAPSDCETVYLREDVRRRVADETRPLEDAVLESIAAQTIEDFFEDAMTGTVRVFEETVVLYSCAARHRGVVVSLDREPDLDYASLLQQLEQLTDAA